MAQAQFHPLEMARFSLGHGQGTRCGPAGEFFPGRRAVRKVVKSTETRGVRYPMSWQRPHSRQILKLCSRVVVSSNVPVASSRREARIALRHFLTGTSWNKCLRKISARRSREKHWVSKTSPTSPAVGPLGQTLCRWNSLCNIINFNEILNHGAGGFPPTYPLALCAVERRRLRHSRAIAALSIANCSGQAFAPQRPTGIRAGGGHSPLSSPGSCRNKAAQALRETENAPRLSVHGERRCCR